MTTEDPTEHRFSRHQTISNTGVLLHKLIAACSSYLEWEVYGTSYKHGLASITDEDAINFAAMAMELLQEIGLTQEQMIQAWNQAKAYREEIEQIARERK